MRRETNFPDENVSRLRLRLATPQRFTWEVRRPAWCGTDPSIAIDGAAVHPTLDGSGYLSLDRQWTNGDLIEITLPMSLRAEALPGDPTRVAIFYGPILLVGALGNRGIPPEGQYATYEKQYTGWPTPPEPALRANPANVVGAIEAVPGDRLNYRIQAIGQPEGCELIPFFRLHGQRYTVYWHLMPAGHKSDSVAGE